MSQNIPAVNGDTINVIVHEAAKETPQGPDYLFWGVIAVAVMVIICILVFYRKPLRAAAGKIKPSEYQFSIAGFSLSGTVEYYTADQQAAWKIYVELITRVTANELKESDGILREAISSLYTTFGILRATLKDAPLDLARPAGEGKYTVASILLAVMNEHMRPFLSKWHPLLQEYEQKKPDTVSQSEHEKKWEMGKDCRNDLHKLRIGLAQYVAMLKSIAEGKTK